MYCARVCCITCLPAVIIVTASSKPGCHRSPFSDPTQVKEKMVNVYSPRVASLYTLLLISLLCLPKILQYCEVLLLFKITLWMYVKVSLISVIKAVFSASLLQSSVSHDLQKSSWFTAKQTFLIIISLLQKIMKYIYSERWNEIDRDYIYNVTKDLCFK